VEADPYNLGDSEATEYDLPKMKAACDLFMNDGTKGLSLMATHLQALKKLLQPV